MISRDVVIVLGYFLLFMLTQRTMQVQPSVFGKLSTFLQLTAVALVLVSLWRADLAREPVRVVVFYVTGAITAVSGLQYMYRGLAWFALAAPPAALEPGQRPDDAAARRRRA